MSRTAEVERTEISTAKEDFSPGPAALSDEWMNYLPPQLRESFAKAQVRSHLNALDDQTPITQDLASVYLDVSDATLKRMRASGKGPQYVQGMSEEGAKSRNQKVLYTVGALKDWVGRNRTDSTGHAAVRRGLMFSSLNDLLIAEPWWQIDGRILGHALACLPVGAQQSEAEICWMSVLEAVKQDWKNASGNVFRDLVKIVMLQEIEHIKALEEKLNIEEEIRKSDRIE